MINEIDSENRTTNSRFAKARVSCFYDSEVLNSSFVHLIKFSAKIPAFAKRQNVMGNAQGQLNKNDIYGEYFE